MTSLAANQQKRTLPTASYKEQAARWPADGRHIIAHYDDNTIVVYQAFRPTIARAAVQANNFHDASVLAAGYSLTRMTWIKTNFLWMMYRSGWASKPGQERILAIRLSRAGFEQILKEAACHGEGDVRLQWDPDHLPSGLKAPGGRKAIQLGLRGNMAERFSREFITSIEDITEFVWAQAMNCNSSAQTGWDTLYTPVEHEYECSEEAAKQIFYSLDRSSQEQPSA